MNSYLVITSINPPTKAIKKYGMLADKLGFKIVVVGDKKSPTKYESNAVYFLSVDEQLSLFNEFARLIPFNHYSRKNLGYLFAIKNGAKIIHDTDDDNMPYKDWSISGENILNSTYLLESEVKFEWLNIYSHYSHEFIWPRGIPLDFVRSSGILSKSKYSITSPIKQYLADGDPDVDAIFRLLNSRNKQVNFKKLKFPIAVSPNFFVPFNSQNTTFLTWVFPLLYLPSFVSFRMTDIWRSFIAQRILWQFDECLSFHNASVYQTRNEHTLLKDFEDEIPGYVKNRRIGEILTGLDLENLSILEMLLHCYEALVIEGIIDNREIELVKQWCNYF